MGTCALEHLLDHTLPESIAGQAATAGCYNMRHSCLSPARIGGLYECQHASDRCCDPHICIETDATRQVVPALHQGI